MSSGDGGDLYLEEALRRIGEPGNANVKESMLHFSSARLKAQNIVLGLKDSLPKKQELNNAIEELSVLFFQLGVRAATAERGLELQNKIDGIANKVDKLDSHGSSTASYADITRTNDKVAKIIAPGGKTLRPDPKCCILITPLEEGGPLKTCEDTKKALLTKIKPAELGINPDRILKSGKSGIKIESKEINTSRINKEALAKAGLKYDVMGKFKPRIAIFGVPKNFEPEDVKSEILEQLPSSQDELITVKSKFGPRDKEYSHWVMEVSPSLRRELLQRGRIYLGWSVCTVKDHLRIIRCYKCQKFGHLQGSCRGSVACGHCAGEHDTRRCSGLGNPPKCINCAAAGLREVGHAPRSNRCVMYNRKVKDLISKIDYGQ